MAKIVTKVGIEVDGKMLVDVTFDEIRPLEFQNGEISDNIFITTEGDEKGLLILRTDKKETISKYSPINSIVFANPKCICVTEYDERLGTRAALISTENLHDLTSYHHDEIYYVTDELYITKKDGLYGVVNHLGEEIMQNKFSTVAYDKTNNAFIAKV